MSSLFVVNVGEAQTELHSLVLTLQKNDNQKGLIIQSKRGKVLWDSTWFAGVEELPDDDDDVSVQSEDDDDSASDSDDDEQSLDGPDDPDSDDDNGRRRGRNNPSRVQ